MSEGFFLYLLVMIEIIMIVLLSIYAMDKISFKPKFSALTILLIIANIILSILF